MKNSVLSPLLIPKESMATLPVRRQCDTLPEGTIFYTKHIGSLNLSIPAACVIHSVTGSGKTWIFDKPLHLIAVPRRSQATHNRGETGSELLAALNRSDKAVKITHDKLLRHLKQPWFQEKMAEYGVKLIVDEAHMLPKKEANRLLAGYPAIFLSGTLDADFRRDLPHLHFERRGGRPRIEIAEQMPAIPAEDRMLLFADRAKDILKTFPNSAYVAESWYDTDLAAECGATRPPIILTINGAATSAYREGVEFLVDRRYRWTVVVHMGHCSSWSYADAVQALNRIRGDDVRRVIVVTRKESVHDLLHREPKSYNTESYTKWLNSKPAGHETVVASAMGSQRADFLYRASNYQSADTWGAHRNLVHSNRRVLPLGYDYAPYQGETDESPLWTKLDMPAGEEEEEEWFNFEWAGTTYQSQDPDCIKWSEWKRSGHLETIYQIVQKHKGNIAKLSGALAPQFKNPKKRGGVGKITHKEVVHALQQMFKTTLQRETGMPMKNYSKNTTKVHIENSPPFGYQNKQKKGDF